MTVQETGEEEEERGKELGPAERSSQEEGSFAPASVETHVAERLQ